MCAIMICGLPLTGSISEDIYRPGQPHFIPVQYFRELRCNCMAAWLVTLIHSDAQQWNERRWERTIARRRMHLAVNWSRYSDLRRADRESLKDNNY